MSDRLRIAVLGSTGSIGRQALEVAAEHGDRIEVVGLAAYRSAELLFDQARSFHVAHVVLGDPEVAEVAQRSMRRDDDPFSAVQSGWQAVAALARESGADMVLNALVGAAGLHATWQALNDDIILALANKESLVVGGELIMPLARQGAMIPVDSEHSAIFQCLAGEYAEDVSSLWLTASGGPFRSRDRDSLADVTPAQALAHPTWHMGPKISIDSSTLMNKGLEVIEAHHLFDVDYDRIKVVVHPQSCIHSMVEYADGSVKAHLGATDMRIPIQYAFSYPRRWDSSVQPVDFATLGSLDFAPVDLDTFGCLRLAFDAGRAGGTLPAAMNAANEVAVGAFLSNECGFLDIERIVDTVMSDTVIEPVSSIEQLMAVDDRARVSARGVVERIRG